MGDLYFERGRLLVQFIEQWSQLFTRRNWYTFHLVMIEFEDDAHMGGVEATIIVLGLGLRVRWNHTETEEVIELKRRIEEVEESIARGGVDDTLLPDSKDKGG